MAHTHSHACIHNTRIHNARKILRGDPTRTLGIARRFIADINRRARKINKAVIDFIVTQDAFGLAERKRPTILVGNVEYRQYEFLTDANKQATFNLWFERLVNEGTLNISESGKYVESAHKRGIANAFAASKAADTADTLGVGDRTVEEYLRSSFLLPETIQKIESLSTRTFESLKGYNAAMANQTSRILAQGLADGHSPRFIAKQMTDAMNTLTKNQAHTIARTEIINAHANGQLDTFENLGVKELGVKAEWITAGDDRVCPDCQGQEGVVFAIEEARGLIPFHPNCRCTWVPFVPDPGSTSKPKTSTGAEARAAQASRRATRTPRQPRPPVAKPVEVIPPPERSFRDLTAGHKTVDLVSGSASRKAIEKGYAEVGAKMKPSGALPAGAQRTSVLEYQGSTYFDINNALWKDTIQPQAWIQKHIDELDSVLKGQTLKEDLMVFRGTKFNEIEMVKGAIIEERGFVSTSVHPSITDSFAELSSGSGKPAQLAIRVPKGTNALHMDRNAGFNTHEFEIVLPRGSKFHVTGETIEKTSVSGSGERTITYHVVELIPDNM